MILASALMLLAISSSIAPTPALAQATGDEAEGELSADKVEFAPGVYGHPSQRQAWDAMMAHTWQISDLAHKGRLDAGNLGDIRPYLLGKMIERHSSSRGMLFVVDWRGQDPKLARELDRLGYFEIARVATSHHRMSLVYLVIDDQWSRDTSYSENKRVGSALQRIVDREALSQRDLIEELGLLSKSLEGMRWEIKQVDYSEETARFSMRLVKRDGAQKLGVRMGFGFELQPKHEQKIDTRDTRRKILLAVTLTSTLLLILWIIRVRKRRERRRWEVERDEHHCPRCGSAQVTRSRTERAECEDCGWRSTLGPLGKKQDFELRRLERVRDGIVAIKAALTHAHAADPRNRIEKQYHALTNGWARQLEACEQAKIHLETAHEVGEDLLEMTPPEQLHERFFEDLEDLLDRDPQLTRDGLERWRKYLLDIHDLMELIEAELELRVWFKARHIGQQLPTFIANRSVGEEE